MAGITSHVLSLLLFLLQDKELKSDPMKHTGVPRAGGASFHSFWPLASATLPLPKAHRETTVGPAWPRCLNVYEHPQASPR